MKHVTATMILLAFCGAAHAEEAKIVFIVEAPANTPKDATLHISGGNEALGNWSGTGLRLTREENGAWRGETLLPVGAVVEFKITQGGWSSVEKTASGGEVSNRRLVVSKDESVRIKVARWAEPAQQGVTPDARAVRRSSRSGNIRLHPDFPSKELANQRDVLVYLPPDYKKSARRYPVLYMHDGQNVFDAATSFLGIEWQADEHAERLITAGRIEPFIIVAIANTPERMNEYTPDRDESRGSGGRGAKYARFLVEEVKPFIDETYRTLPDREHTAVAGSSLGGLISLYICREYPKTFSMCGVISPALMWNEDAILKELEESDNAWMRSMRFWVDMGSKEGRQTAAFNGAISRTRRLIDIFDKAGLAPGRDYYYQEVHEGEHNEAAWAARFDKILLYFFAAQND